MKRTSERCLSLYHLDNQLLLLLLLLLLHREPQKGTDLFLSVASRKSADFNAVFTVRFKKYGTCDGVNLTTLTI